MQKTLNFFIVSTRTMKILLTVLIACVQVACSDKDDTIVAEETVGNTGAIAVYNHAYIENYTPDQVGEIVLNAKEAYVLLDPYEDGVIESIPKIKANGNQLAAYISIGTGEDWRDDFDDLKPYLTTEQWNEWPGEYFVNNTTTGIVDLMKSRIDQIADWGFDWVEFDNMDWALYEDAREAYGLEVTKEESIAYFQELCAYVHKKGMKCMAKNFVENAENFDGVTYESYHHEKNWWETSGAQSFLEDGKLVIIVHYNESNCDQVYSDYTNLYNKDLAFICEDTRVKKYVHYNGQ
ncbi:endo alpha-1,4 polygalactosaminidase [Zobellia uliginosa]|uniref:endo alpha-1,4 polygalactosaminidase n=1 Tax=Zobellia uliginosa TaxID=143224 RepID=UPI0026E49426|nr:endo alpha-1,4 polygalactosaminidase [Zobellia uliginosa]MDO6515724.1 endo alpha-1,4 polygalactosaminidase [Zobellia uliginosa]